MRVAPVHQCDHDGAQLAPGRRQGVLESRASTLGPVCPTLDDPLVDQQRQTLGEDVAGDAEVLLQGIEPAYAVEEVAHDQDGPAVTEDLRGLGDRAGRRVVVGHGHGMLQGLSSDFQLRWYALVLRTRRGPT